MRGVRMTVDPAVMVAAYDHYVVDLEDTRRPGGTGDDLVRVERRAATNVGYQMLGLALAAVTVPRRVHDACPFRQLREHALAAGRDAFRATFQR